MGFFVKIIASRACIPHLNLARAHAALVKLNEHDAYKRGRSSEPGSPKWFSGMSPDYPVRCHSAQAVFEEVGYTCKTSSSGLELIHYDYKSGCEDVFVWAASELFEPHSFIEWQGEDARRFRWDFGGGIKLMRKDESDSDSERGAAGAAGSSVGDSETAVSWDSATAWEPIRYGDMYDRIEADMRQRISDSARAAVLLAQMESDIMASYLISPDQAAYNLKMKAKSAGPLVEMAAPKKC